MLFTPLLTIINGIALFVQSVRHNAAKWRFKKYKSVFLKHCNSLLNNTLNLQLWAIILCIPIIALCTVLLIIFGQDGNSLLKAFTETTTLDILPKTTSTNFRSSWTLSMYSSCCWKSKNCKTNFYW